MASDNRDWFRDWWRKKTGYVERAGFRMSEADRLKAKPSRYDVYYVNYLSNKHRKI